MAAAQAFVAAPAGPAGRAQASGLQATPVAAAGGAALRAQDAAAPAGRGSATGGALVCALAVAGGRGALKQRRRKARTVAVRAVRRPCHGGEHLSEERKAELVGVVQQICTPGKGITATDEGPGTIGIRFEAVGVENTEENRRQYRQMLYKTPGINQYLSAAILDPETIYQKDDDGKLFPEVLSNLGIVPGIKPHLKVYTLPGTGGDTVMQGLDSLSARCAEYKAAGCKFAKWRSPLAITEDGCPTDLAIKANMEDLARYALICQDEGLVPIVEPDIVMKGTHTLKTAVEVNTQVQSALYKAMLDHGVFMEGCVMKTNLVNPGLDCPESYTVEEIADANLTVLRRVMPMAVPGVNYLSGGQSLEDAAARLDAMNKMKTKEPWNLSFSWSWALQAPLFKLCEGTGGKMPLDDMGALYLEELGTASAAALGKHEPAPGDGGHTAKKVARPTVGIGINGFGRIGRQVARIVMKDPETELRLVNASYDAEYLAYQMKYDSIHGRYDGTVEVDGDSLVIDGHKVALSHTRDPAEIPFKKYGADYVCESTGVFLTDEKIQPHLKAGAKKVVFSAPAKDDSHTIVMGVNQDTYKSDMNCVSCASCTTNGLAPMVKAVNDAFGIKRGLMTTIHAMTASQPTVDGASKKDWRGGRAASGNIIPSSTGAAKAVAKVVPEVAGKLTGMAFRVPTIDVSVVDLTCELEKATTYEEICAEIKRRSLGDMKGFLGYCDDALVSTDFETCPISSTFDSKAGIMLDPTFVKLVAWYDNEWGYSCRVVDLIKHMAKTDAA